MKKLSIFSLARENMRRRVFQTLAVVLMVGVATATLFTATMLLWGMKAGVRRGMGIMGADLLVTPEANELDTRTLLVGEAQRMVLGPAAPPALVERDLLSSIAKVKGVEAVTPQTYLASWNEGSC